MINAITTLAQLIGYVVLTVAALIVVGSVLSNHASHSVSPEARQFGEKMEAENGYNAGISAVLAEGVLDAVDEIGDDIDLKYEPAPAASFDWSAGPAELTEDHIRKAGGGLEAAGFHVHPFPRSPDDMGSDEWHWSDRHVGVWLDEPTFYIPTEHGREIVDTDLSEWAPETQ